MAWSKAWRARIRLTGARAIAVVMGAAVASFSVGAADATVRISDDRGGLMAEYASRFASMQQSGERVVVDGPCYSACTMLLGMLSRDRICVTPRAVLGFHAAWNFDGAGRQVTSLSATRVLIDTYPPYIRSWLARHGGLSPQIKVLRGRELASMYPLCR
jgi:hypothetical protein